MDYSIKYIETSGSLPFMYGKINELLPYNIYNDSEWDMVIENAWNGIQSIFKCKQQ